MTTQKLLDKLLELAERQARLVLLELKMPSLMPAWVLLAKSGKIEVLAIPWEDDQDKDQFQAMLRARMRQTDVVAYSFLSEAWSRSLEPGEWDEESGQPLDGISASDHPARQEMVIACACTARLSRWKQWRIVREATTEVIVDLKEHVFPESDKQPASWMTELLK